MIYFAESSANRIDVATLDGSKRAPLISSNLTSPRGLALDPRKGLLFITDWGGTARILRTQMDGSNMRTLVTERVGWPNGITIDYEEETKNDYFIEHVNTFNIKFPYNRWLKRDEIKKLIYDQTATGSISSIYMLYFHDIFFLDRNELIHFI